MLFLGEARPDGIAAIGDAPEGIFDGQRVDGGRIVVAGPFFDVGVARVSRISDRFEQIVEARDAPTVLGRSVSFAADIARIGDARLAGANVAHGEAMLPRPRPPLRPPQSTWSGPVKFCHQGARGGRTFRIRLGHRAVKIDFGIMPWMPLVPSTAWVTW
jgi:hypothetical protein